MSLISRESRCQKLNASLDAVFQGSDVFNEIIYFGYVRALQLKWQRDDSL